MKILENFKEVIFVIFLSVVFGGLFNSLRDNGISWVAHPIDLIEDSDEFDFQVNQPTIREISLITAKSLHEKGTLFVDARAVEYLEDGFIPGAIANDDIDSLFEMIVDVVDYDMNNEFVIYCSDDDCGSSENLAYSLQGLGYNNILVFKGGWKSWKEAGYQVEKNDEN